MRGAFAFQFEDDHAGIMAGGKEIEGGVAGNHPEPVILPPERVKASPLGHVPDADAFILAVAQDELLSRVEAGAADIVVVAPAGVHLPRLGEEGW